MSIAPLPLPRRENPRRGDRLVASRPATAPTGIARRHLAVGVTKRLLPLVALALLTIVALWPELGQEERSRFSYRTRGIAPQAGQLTDVRYNGVDDHGRPYTMTASTAHQISSERINLTDPKGDISLDNGTWLMSRAQQGVYTQHVGQLDLAGEVVLYRDDGLTLVTEAATLDLKAGAAAGAVQVHAEGPFGVLDAQGFALLDRGAVVQFTGPGRLVLNGHGK
ncbi:LPS export ABC transporter periplasmic protein LptC [Rhodovastum atsumiense]|uniref:LPS export ABC transporter periplasmic protein LptC n=1 Tax=Rhodovastum atsumiense TaxID=504468 RepID=A0A5M6J1F5_9PROT|nr:LPS export ABC transporter periplasmic protein LptC [Rhodovastum atsumiense]KAA5614334.1 LPS export ABC transporter periplasmic protein LptC [Rhodovastum atsumiense]CAH2604802.1 LPS export ABC transporter periplasmic protein LptC [Rhodovastum atsumiense]